MTTLGEMGEQAAIRRMVAGLGSHPDLRVGAGDDCAVTRLPGGVWDQVFTTDPIIEGIHFLLQDAAERVGNKAVGRVLSDLAAMGAKPQWILVNVVAPPTLEMARLDGIYAGMNAICKRFGAPIIGGDLAQGAVLELHVFGTGTVPAGSAVLRSGAQAGDAVFVTGALGGSRAGKHLDFVPRVREGAALRSTGRVHAMMDLSDGLATDLRHILRASGVGAVLNADAIPKNESLEAALFDGEDFELLFTASELDPAKLDFPIFQIGQITDRANTLELRQTDGTVAPLKAQAFEHFVQ